MAKVRTWMPLWAIAIGLVVALVSPLVTEAQQAPPKAKAPAASAATKLLDVNTATQEELEKLPGVGEATAKKIITGRPYASMDDLTKKLTDAKVSKATISKITPLVTVAAPAGAAAGAAAAKPATTAPAPSLPPAAAKAGEATKSTAAATAAQTPPQKGMVWVNTDSKIYHKEGDRWYGKTKQGKWMTEADALKEGNRAAKN